MISIIFFAVLLTGSCLANPVTDAEYFDIYIKNLQNHLNETVKPCDDFQKYACGKLERNNVQNMLGHLIETNLNNNKIPTTEDEKFLKSFYSTCKQGGDVTKIIDQIDELKFVKTWPVDRDFDDQEIAKLLGFLATIAEPGIGISFQILGQENVITLITTPNFQFDEENLTRVLEKYGQTSDQIKGIVEKFLTLRKQLLDINISQKHNKIDKLNNVAALKEAIPDLDWDTFFSTWAKVFDLDISDIVNRPVHTGNLKELKELVNIFKATESKTVVNFIIWRYISQLNDNLICKGFIEFFYPIVGIKYNNEKYDNYFENEKLALNIFEKSFDEIKSQLNNPESKLKNKLEIQRNVYENYEMFLTGKYLTSLLNIVEVNKDNFYTTIVKIFHALFKDIVADGNKNINALGVFLRSSFGDAVITGTQQKTILHQSLVNVNTDLWIKAMAYTKNYENKKIDDKCYAYENKIENRQNQYYLTAHAGYDTAMQEYLDFMEEHKDQFKKQTEILNEVGWNHAKSYTIALAQLACENFPTSDLFWYFKHSKRFSDTWNCKAGDEMYQVCDDSTFVPKLK